MTGPVYDNATNRHRLTRIIPDPGMRHAINATIFDEFCQGVFRAETTSLFMEATNQLKAAGADCVILGCTEIPFILSEDQSTLPVLDSTRLLAAYAVSVALQKSNGPDSSGWLDVPKVPANHRTG